MIGGGDMYGDRSETFALIHWFPTPLQFVQRDFVYSFALSYALP
jgi:hypothetical protein